jgi:hypothetical protein
MCGAVLIWAKSLMVDGVELEKLRAPDWTSKLGRNGSRNMHRSDASLILLAQLQVPTTILGVA